MGILRGVVRTEWKIPVETDANQQVLQAKDRLLVDLEFWDPSGIRPFWTTYATSVPDRLPPSQTPLFAEMRALLAQH